MAETKNNNTNEIKLLDFNQGKPFGPLVKLSFEALSDHAGIACKILLENNQVIIFFSQNYSNPAWNGYFGYPSLLMNIEPAFKNTHFNNVTFEKSSDQNKLLEKYMEMTKALDVLQQKISGESVIKSSVSLIDSNLSFEKHPVL